MFCKKCGSQLEEDSKFCKSCGNATAAETTPQQTPIAAQKTPKVKKAWYKRRLVWAAVVLVVIIIIVSVNGDSIDESAGITFASNSSDTDATDTDATATISAESTDNVPAAAATEEITEPAPTQSDVVLMYADSEFQSYNFGVDVPDFFPFTSFEQRSLNEYERYDRILEEESCLVYFYKNYDLTSDGAARYGSLLESLGFVQNENGDNWQYYVKGNVSVNIWINEGDAEIIESAEVTIFYDYPTFNDIVRYPDENKGKNVEFTGEVQQVIEGDNSIELRLATKFGQYEMSDDIIYVYYDKPLTEGRILEYDIITVYGVSEGLVSYEAVLGHTITLPLVIADEIIQH